MSAPRKRTPRPPMIYGVRALGRIERFPDLQDAICWQLRRGGVLVKDGPNGWLPLVVRDAATRQRVDVLYREVGA